MFEVNSNYYIKIHNKQILFKWKFEIPIISCAFFNVNALEKITKLLEVL